MLSQKTYLFFIILFIIQFYYFFIDFFITGLFSHYGYSVQASLMLVGILFTHGIILIALIYIYYGISLRKTWTRKFTIFYLGWASLWALWGLLVGNNPLIHLLILLFSLTMIFYLTTPAAQAFFTQIYRYGKYILYTRIVYLKSGMKIPIYFFSSHPPKSGHPTSLPEKYAVFENPRSHMPYLKKKHTSTSKNQNITPVSPKKVLYVVNNSNQSALKGQWSIRSKQKIISNHRTKQTAIKKARYLARKQQARVLVQNTNGRFSYGFKPRQSRPT